MSNLLTFAAVCLTASNQPVSIQSLPSVSISRDWIDFATFAVSVILMVIGGIGVYAAIRTLKAVKKQADEMVEQATLLKEQTAVAKQAADAALLNAQAVINAERPWMLIEQPLLTFGPLGAKAPSVTVTFKAKNVGKSPAEIVHSATRLLTSLPGQQMREGEPFFSEGTPDDTHWAHTVWKAPEETFSPDALSVHAVDGADLWKLITQGSRVLIVMGFIRYRDAIAFGIHESRFCYLISLKPESIVMTGPPGYNRLT